ncbi:MAG: hypothetical protein JXQ73_04140 [Phycisphaerae bacterium]|nr:hypothetical protein [Phycisphaerae bacterium]
MTHGNPLPDGDSAADERKPPKVTFMEFLISALVFAIVGWICVPRFTQAADAAGAARPTQELQALRAQIERYRLDHDGRYPSADDFIAQMTGLTRGDGTPCQATTAGPRFGPYLRTIPVNPETGGNRVAGLDPAGGHPGEADWLYDEAAGTIISSTAAPPETISDRSADTRRARR